MAKQRRPSSHPARSKPAQTVAPSAAYRSTADGRVTAPSRSSHSAEALALYETGVAALQAHDYARAASLLQSVIASYPGERELHERVRLYLNVCERHMTPSGISPTTPEERLFAATLALNAGNADEALQHLLRVSAEAPDNDHALYMLATVLAQHDRAEEAVPHLIRAMELNPENRVFAKRDPDLEPLRHYADVQAALEAASNLGADRRKHSRRSR